MARSILTPFAFSIGGNTITNHEAATVPLTIKGASGQSAPLLEIRNSSNTLLSYNLSNGDWVMPNLFNSYAGVGTGYADYQGGATSLYVRPTLTTRSGAVIKGLASQTANLLELQDSTAAVKLYANASGDMSLGSVGLGFVTPYSTYGNALLSISTVGAANKGIVVRGSASQSANLTEWQSSAGSILARVDSVGDITARVLRSTFAARIQTNDAQTAVIVSTAAANQSADHLQYQNSAGTVLGGTTANGFQYIGSATSLRFLNYTLTAASASSTTVATFTYNTVSTVNQVAVGQKVIVSGVTPSSYNGSFNVTAIGGSSGAWTFTVTAPSAPFVVGSASGFGTFSVDTGLSVQTLSAGMPGLIIRGVTSQVANIFEYRNAGNSLQTYITPAGDFVAPAISAIWAITSSAQDVNVNAMRARTSVASGYKANLQTWESSTTVLAGINSPGKFFTGATSGITTAIGGTIQSIAAGANPLVTMASAHGLAVGDVVVLAGTTGGTYNGTFFVATTPASTTFTITSALTTGQAGAAGTVSVDSQVSVTARSAGVKGLVVRGAASQVANLFEVQDSAGSLMARIEPSGNLVIAGIGVTSGDHRVGTSSYFSAALNVQARSTTERGQVIRGQASQTADALQIQTSAGTVLAGDNGVGQFYTGSTSPILTASGGTIQSIAAGANPLVTMASAHGFTTGDLVTLAGTTGGTYNGTFVVASTPASTTFTITTALTTGQAGTGGTASDPAQASITARSAATTCLVVRGATSQSVDLIQTQTSAGSINFGVDSVGSVFTAAIMGTDRQNAIVLGGSRNVALNTGAGSFAGGAGVTFFGNASTAPTSNPTGGGILYVASGALTYRGTSGSAVTIVNANGTVSLLDPVLSSVSTIGGGGSEGGQINFARVTDGAQYWYIDSFGSTASPDLRFVENTTERFRFTAGGAFSVNGQVGTSGQVLSSNGSASAPTWRSGPVDGTTSTATTGYGYMGMPQNSTTSGAYTVVAADAGKHLYSANTRTVTINSNANLALPVGTTITFISGPGATTTIAITSDTMYLAGPGTTGSRTLAPFGMATAVKTSTTSWFISGNGLT